MISYSEKTKDISVDVLVLPGFSEGLSRRGAWFAYTQDSEALIKKFRFGCSHVLRYVIHEPTSQAGLSDAEITHLINQATSSLDQYRSELEALERSFKDLRSRGKLDAILYIFAIITIRWYWWIFLTRGEISFTNQQNAKKQERAANTKNIFSRFWIRGDNSFIKKILDEVAALYEKTDQEPLKKYSTIRDHALRKVKNSSHSEKEAWQQVAEAYREIIKKYTGKSLVLELLPTSFFKRIIFFLFRTFTMPKPETLFPVRNLKRKIPGCRASAPITSDNGKKNDLNYKLPGNDRVDGNLLELFLLATPEGDPVCVPVDQAFQIIETMARSEIIRENDLPMEILLHVGSDKEKDALSGCESGSRSVPIKLKSLHSRLQNAALDTKRQNEAIIAYYFREVITVHFRRFQVEHPFRSRLHSLFPWLFITNGIPIASVLAAAWLFVDPYYQGKMYKKYYSYYDRMLESIDWAYHNLVIRVECNPALGYINNKIKNNNEGKAFRDIMRDINEFALPVSLMDRALVNNLTMETNQLLDYRRPANNFTSIPNTFFQKQYKHGPNLNDLPGGG